LRLSAQARRMIVAAPNVVWPPNVVLFLPSNSNFMEKWCRKQSATTLDPVRPHRLLAGLIRLHKRVFLADRCPSESEDETETGLRSG